MYHITLSAPQIQNTFFFQFHYFTPSFQKYQEYKKEFIEFGEQKKNEIAKVTRKWEGKTPSFIIVEIEEIPIDIHSEYKVIAYYRFIEYEIPDDAIFTIIENIPDDLKEKIINYRKQYIAIDYVNTNAIDIYHGLLEKYHDVKVYKANNGYHFYIPHKWESFEENLNIRKQYSDNDTRLKLDKIYIKSGVPYLTNALFNKMFHDSVTQSVPNNFSEEKEISPKDITYTLDKIVEYPLVEFNEVINGIRVMRDKNSNKVFATADATVIKSVSELDQFLTDFVENGYKKYVDIEKLLYAKYHIPIKYGMDIQWEKKGDKLLIIYVPEKYVGRAIGTGGKNVKEIEQILGLRVKVIPMEKEAKEREQKKNEVVNRIMSIMRDIDSQD